MGISVVIGQWYTIYLMVVPSLQNFGHYHVDMGMHQLLKTLGFVGFFPQLFHFSRERPNTSNLRLKPVMCLVWPLISRKGA
tara:strand:- start:453 stop:695 length:243 start_codon:yes stop_codon:yes gene_type:complete